MVSFSCSEMLLGTDEAPWSFEGQQEPERFPMGHTEDGAAMAGDSHKIGSSCGVPAAPFSPPG